MTEIHEEYLRDILQRLADMGVIKESEIQSIIDTFENEEWHIYHPEHAKPRPIN